MSTSRSTANYLLEGIADAGVEFIFANMGTDHAPLIEEMAAWDRASRTYARVILCPHENTAMHMAGGYALATGRAQLVITHVDAGTANCAMAAHNLRRSRLPVILFAGKAPYSSRNELIGCRDNYVHFIQEPFDQAAIVRPYVKWEYDLPSGIVVKEVLQRAAWMANSHPRGPVYLTARREVLAEHWPEDNVHRFPSAAYSPSSPAAAPGRLIAEIGSRLLDAKRPLIITSYAGRNAAVPALLEQLAAATGSAVVEASPQHVNISRKHPCFAGYLANERLKDADIVLLLDTDVPYLLADAQLAEDAWCAHIDADADKEDIPLWTFPAQLRLRAEAAEVLRQLLEWLQENRTPASIEAAALRMSSLAMAREERASAAARQAQAPGSVGAINPHHLVALISQRLGDDCIVVNEAVRNALPVLEQMPRTLPGTYFCSGGGGLGFSSGIALGMKLARPAADVVQFMGDGVFYLNNFESFLAVSSGYGLPILTVVLDNGGWAAVKSATTRVYRDGEASSSNRFQSELPQINFAPIAASVAGHGELVADPAELPEAIDRCLAAVRGGKPAVLHVRVTRL